MPFSQADIDALKAAIAKGVRRVEYQDKAVTYNSLDEMIRALRLMEDEAGVKKKGGRAYAEFGKGIC